MQFCMVLNTIIVRKLLYSFDQTTEKQLKCRAHHLNCSMTQLSLSAIEWFLIITVFPVVIFPCNGFHASPMPFRSIDSASMELSLK
jgi:hypothetical protein